MRFTNRGYDALKGVAQIWLPAAATLYFALASIWGLPDTTQVIGSITAVDTFLGVILGLSTKAYTPEADGRLVIDSSDPAKDTASIEFDQEPDLKGKRFFTLAVVPAKKA